MVIHESRLSASPTAGHAESAALLALRAGESRMPAPAAAVLARTAPVKLKALRHLFDETTARDAVRRPARIGGYLKSVDAELSTIEEMLTGG